MVPQQQIHIAKDNFKNLAGPVSIPNIRVGLPLLAVHFPASGFVRSRGQPRVAVLLHRLTSAVSLEE